MAAMYFFNNSHDLSTRSIHHDLSTPVRTRPHYSAQNRLCLGFRFTSLKTLSTSPAEQFNKLGYSLETCKNKKK